MKNLPITISAVRFARTIIARFQMGCWLAFNDRAVAILVSYDIMYRPRRR